MSAVAKSSVNGPPSLTTIDPPTSCMIGPFGDQGYRDGAGENIAAGDFCYVAASGKVLRALEDQTGTTAAVSDVQTMSASCLLADITGGSLTLGYKGQYTPAYNATPGSAPSNATVQTDMRALSTIGAGNITVAGTFPNFTFTGAGALAGVELELIEVESSLITDLNTPQILSMAHTTVGQPVGASGAEQAQSRVRGIATIPYKLGQPVTLYHGVMMIYSDGLLTPGADYYLSATVPGGLDTAPTLTGQKPIAWALDTQRLFVFGLN